MSRAGQRLSLPTRQTFRSLSLNQCYASGLSIWLMISFSGSDNAWEINLQDTIILKAFTPVLWSKCVRIALYLQQVVWISHPCAWMAQKAQCKLGDEFHLRVIFWFYHNPKMFALFRDLLYSLSLLLLRNIPYNFFKFYITLWCLKQLFNLKHEGTKSYCPWTKPNILIIYSVILNIHIIICLGMSTWHLPFLKMLGWFILIWRAT